MLTARLGGIVPGRDPRRPPRRPEQLGAVLGRALPALVGAPELVDVEPVAEVLAPAPRRARLDRLTREAIAIEERAAQDAGELAYYGRLLLQCTMPHSARPGSSLERVNGKLRLSIVAPPSVGLPYGKLPRLLLAWLTTEAVRTRSPRLDLGPSLSAFMRELGLIPSGGAWGSIGRLKDQARRLFSSTIACTYSGPGVYEDMGFRVAGRSALWWNARDPEQAALFGSYVELTEEFYRAVTRHPVPVDMRALRALRSPLALDLYMWSSWRFFNLREPVEVPWPLLAAQFGGSYSQVRQCKAAILKHLRAVLVVYPSARFAEGERGLILSPSPPHVARRLS